MQKINKYLLWALMAISLIVCIFFFCLGTEQYATTAGEMEAPAYTSMLLNWCYFLLILAAAATVAFAAITFGTKLKYDWKSVMVPTISVVVVAILLLATYWGADTTPINIIGYEGSQEPSIYRITNMCLTSSVVLAAIATFCTLFGFLAKKF